MSLWPSSIESGMEIDSSDEILARLEARTTSPSSRFPLLRSGPTTLEPPHPSPKVTLLVYNHPSVKISEGVTMSNLDNALRELREKRRHTQVEIEKLDQLISGIESLNGAGAAVPDNTVQPKRIISAASRRKMALAQKARWAGLREKSQPIAVVANSTISAPAKRTMSASAPRKIAAAQKARWAKIRAQEKKAA
jgi:hypothetical protein